ncbi:MAG: alpha/beta hydrolase [Desulfatibacillum sp.]|nr:alpha/beta hydrolase [Desulfatibacillum sp.]
MRKNRSKFWVSALFVVVLVVFAYVAVNTTLFKPSVGSRLARLVVVHYLAPRFTADTPYQKTRDTLEFMAKLGRLPLGTRVEETHVAGLRAEWVRARTVPEDSSKVLLYFHGGGFFCGSANTHKSLAAMLSKASKMPVLLPEYRLAPEHKYPAANLDCLDSYLWLLEQGYKPENIAIGGDSAGGCLTLMTLLTLKEKGLPMPGAAILISPVTDAIHFDGESIKTRDKADPLFAARDIGKHMTWYGGEKDQRPALMAPLNMDLSGLPPLFIQAGDDEILLSDSTRLAEKAKKAGVDVTLEVWENMWHVFQSFGVIVPEARQAIANLGAFLQEKLS